MQLVISDVEVKQDKEGRYYLNDLHKAAGNERRSDPHDWLRLKQTKEIVEELSTTGIPVVVINGGKKRGTYVCKSWFIRKRHIQTVLTLMQM